MQQLSDYLCDLGQGRGNVTVDITIYSIEAINAAAYPFLKNYHILVTPDAILGSVVVLFEAKADGSDIMAVLKEYCNSLLDNQLRVYLESSNGKIRDLIVAHAFSPLDLQKETNSL